MSGAQDKQLFWAIFMKAQLIGQAQKSHNSNTINRDVRIIREDIQRHITHSF